MKRSQGIIPELEYLRTLPLRPDRVIGRHKYLSYAVFVPFLSIGGVTHWLFEKRSKTIRQGGEICFPGGAVELENGEDPAEAALRETSEELGVPLKAVELAGHLGHLFTRWGGLIDVFYGTLSESAHQPVSSGPFHPHSTPDAKEEPPMREPDPLGDMSAREEPNPRGEGSLSLNLHPQKDEVEAVFTVPVSFFQTTKPEVHLFRQLVQPRFKDSKGKLHALPLKKLGLPSRYSKSYSLHTYKVSFYRYKGETIWGITADIINEFLELLSFPKTGIHLKSGGE